MLYRDNILHPMLESTTAIPHFVCISFDKFPQLCVYTSHIYTAAVLDKPYRFTIFAGILRIVGECYKSWSIDVTETLGSLPWWVIMYFCVL